MPALAAKPDWNTTQASTFLNRAMRRSSSMCSVMVPEMVRTAPEPAPYFFAASTCGFHQLGMIGEPEIIVGGEIDHFASIEAGRGLASRFQHAQALIGAGFAPAIELVAEKGEWFGGGHSTPIVTLQGTSS